MDTTALSTKSQSELIALLLKQQALIDDKEKALRVLTTEKEKALKILTDEKEQALKKLADEKEETLKKLTDEIERLRHQLTTALHNKYKRKSEQWDFSRQGRLFDEAESAEVDKEAIEVADAETTVAAHQRKKSGRKPLPEILERIKKEYDIDEQDKICSCGCTLTRIGEEVSEQLEFIPAKVQVIQHIRFKYSCKSCEETVKTAKAPKQPIEKSIASPGLLAQILVAKYQHHLPLNRQEQIFKSIGVHLVRHTMALWVIRCGELLAPLIKLMHQKQLAYDIAYADETTAQVLKEPDKTASSKSYMWLFVGGQPACRNFIYQYHPTRSHSVAKDHFADFKGWLHSDGYAGYTALFNSTEIQGVHCWAHARRKFMDIIKTVKTNKTGLSHWAAAQIGKLYQVEREAKENKLNAAQRHQLRHEKSKPLLEEMKAWLEKNVRTALPKAPIGQALAYCLKYWNNLVRYLEDGRLEIDNNLAERAIRPFAIGRKNWMFSNSVAGAKASATIYSLIETCKYHQIDPLQYLKKVLEEIPSCENDKDYEKLLPFNLILDG